MASSNLFRKSDCRRLVVSQLVLLQQITRASVPLMVAAREEAMARSDDPVSQMLVPYLAHHIEEERDHDLWTLEDLESIGLGLDRRVVLNEVPSRHVAGLVGAQYYWIRHHHPVALMGYMLMLEANAPTDTMIDQLKAITCYPESLFRTHRAHAALDPDHQAAMYDLLDLLPLVQSQENLIVESILATGERMADCLANPKSWDFSDRANALLSVNTA
jgi:hypothetical protein